MIALDIDVNGPYLASVAEIDSAGEAEFLGTVDVENGALVYTPASRPLTRLQVEDIAAQLRALEVTAFSNQE